MCQGEREREREAPCSRWASRGRVRVSRFDASKNVTIRKYSGCCEGGCELRRVPGVQGTSQDQETTRGGEARGGAAAAGGGRRGRAGDETTSATQGARRGRRTEDAKCCRLLQASEKPTVRQVRQRGTTAYSPHTHQSSNTYTRTHTSKQGPRRSPAGVRHGWLGGGGESRRDEKSRGF